MNEEDKLKPVHPGEVLQEEFLKPLRLSQNRVALAIRVPARRINEIIQASVVSPQTLLFA
jgi:antitoxin HigA-1